MSNMQNMQFYLACVVPCGALRWLWTCSVADQLSQLFSFHLDMHNTQSRVNTHCVCVDHMHMNWETSSDNLGILCLQPVYQFA